VILAFPFVPELGKRYEGTIEVARSPREPRTVVECPYVVLREATIEEWKEDRRMEQRATEEEIEAAARLLQANGVGLYDVSVD
jgi:hypothetical protein